MKKRIITIALIVAATFAVYAPALKNGFVWDDTALVLRDPLIRSWRLIPEGLRHFLFLDATASDFYRPMQRLTYTWDYAWFRFAPWGWHLSNVILHAAAAVVLFLFLEKLLRGEARESVLSPVSHPEGSFAERNAVEGSREAAGNRIFALLIALVWAIHPLHTSAVTYVAGRADLLAALFGFAGLFFILRRTWLALSTASVCFLAAMLSKENGVMFIPLGVLLLWLRNGWRSALRLVPLALVVIAIYGALRFSAAHEVPPASEKPGWAARPIIIARAWAEYAGLLVAPVNLHMERDVLPFGRGDMAATVRAAQPREFQTLLGAALIAAFAFWMRWTRRTEPAAFACLLCFLAAYVPVSNLLPLNATVAEHWLYVPSAFLLMATALSLAHVRLSRAAGALILGLWMCALAARTFTRNFDWRDQRTFLERTIADGGGSARMLMNLGSLESAQGHQQIAIGHFQNALQIAPDHPVALLGISGAYLRANDFPHAREFLEKATRIPQVRAEAIQNLAILEYKESSRDRVDLLREAANSAPENWAIQKRFISHLYDRGDRNEALPRLRDLLQKQWWRAESWRLLGDFWQRTGAAESAQRAYARAVSYDVHDDESRRKLEAPPSENAP